MDLTEDVGAEDEDDDVQIIERPKEHAKQLQKKLNRFKGASGRRARSLNEIMQDHERRKSGGVIDVDDDAALARALQAKDDSFESDRALAKKLQAELNASARMAPSKPKAGQDTSGDAALARRLADKDKGRSGQTPSWVGKAKPKDRSRTKQGWEVDDNGLLDALADQRKSIESWLATNA